jgi:2-methylcitrate dehydratase PrpD
VAGEIERLAQFVALTQWQDVPESVQHHTKLVLLDTLGVMLAGSERPEVRALTVRLAGSASIGATVLARGWPVTDSRTAALLNGIAGRSIELCEGLRLVSGQAAMQVLPAVQAVGEQVQCSGREILTAFDLGYEIAGRFCAAFTPRPLHTRTGRHRFWGRSLLERACGGWIRAASAVPCALRPQCC